MTTMQIYAAYVAPILLVLMGVAIRARNLHRITQAHRKAGKAEA